MVSGKVLIKCILLPAIVSPWLLSIIATAFDLSIIVAPSILCFSKLFVKS